MGFTIRFGSRPIANFTGAPGRIANHGNLEYGARRGHNAGHFVRFNSKVQMNEGISLTGGAHSELPDNSPQNIVVPRPPRRHSAGSVTLYMPAQINVSQKANYGEPEMGIAVGSVISGMKNIGAGEGGFGGTLDSLVKTFQESTGGVGQLAADAVEGVGATGLGSAAQINAGRVVNNTTELMFEGIDRRAFSFSFRLIPHNAAEADQIQNIVNSFRYHMAPSKPGDGAFGRTLVAPSTYDINYSHQAELHRISECVLESVDVKYGGDRPQFYRDNHPTETELTLQFKELEIMTKDRIEEGF